mmetsp:Transcript_50594/g.107778  ORF Transcript_50594/g.107778 Transcript_50594/m.107778 type:complete len:404 (+) Transcript_50594:122-1333(+)
MFATGTFLSGSSLLIRGTILMALFFVMHHCRRRYLARRKQIEASNGGDGERNAVQFPAASNSGGSMSRELDSPGTTSRWDDSNGQKTDSIAATNKEKMAIPEGAACYICLDDGLDEEGKPLVRDCACRGDSSGFVHMSCLVEYAREKSKLHSQHSWDNACFEHFEKHWCACPICDQEYQNQLSQDLGRAILSFAEETYAVDPSKSNRENVISQLRIMDAVSVCHLTVDSWWLDEGKTQRENNGFDCGRQRQIEDDLALLNRLLSIVEQVKKDLQMKDEWLHRSKDTWEYKMYELIRTRYESFCYFQLGSYFLFQRSASGYERALSYWEKARIINILLGRHEGAELIEDSMKIPRQAMLNENLEWQMGEREATAVSLELEQRSGAPVKPFWQKVVKLIQEKIWP